MNASVNHSIRLLRAALFPVVAGGLLLTQASLFASDFRVDPGSVLGTSGLSGSNPFLPDATPEKVTEQEEKATEITATEETSFDERARVATFIGNVRVNDAQFKLSCDKLIAHLKRANSPAAAAGAEEEGGGLERAIAEGNVVIVQEKLDDKGEVTRYIGRANKAEYVAATGEVILTGWPQIQQGINNQVATEKGTVMILNRSGRLKTIGASKTVIKDSSETNPTAPASNSRRNAR